MSSSFRIQVRAVLVIALFTNGCALRAQSPLSTETSVNSGGASGMPALAAVAVSPTLSALANADAAPSPERALSATQGGVAFDALVSVPGSQAANVVKVRLRNANSRDEFEIGIGKDGSVAGAQVAVLDSFLACRRTGRMRAISPGVLRVLAAIAEEFPERTIEVISGYRAPPFGVKDSKHFGGRAIDLRVKGVKLAKVRDFVWQRFSDVGVGYYGPQNFIHVDHRPEEKDTAWSSAHEDAVYEYNPRWAMRIRPPWQEPLDLMADEHGHEHELELEGEMAMSDVIESTAP